jgi:hypothetical protein
MRRIHFLVVALTLVFATAMFAQEKKTFIYQGSKSCKKCHFTKKSGAAYKVWQKTKHAQAFEVLASEKALAIAKEKGIADPQKAGECLQCHVTAHGVDAKLLGPKFSHEEGVGCEACHGAGSEYNDKEVKKDVVAGKIEAKSVGLLKPTEEDCKKCHNDKSPTFKEFDFKKMSEEIAHPTPEKK